MMHRRKIYKKAKKKKDEKEIIEKTQDLKVKRNNEKATKNEKQRKGWQFQMKDKKIIIYTYFSFYFIIITKMIYLRLIYLSQKASYNIQLQWQFSYSV